MQNKSIYIDLDGVIINPCNRLYNIYKELMKNKPILSKKEYWGFKRRKISEEEILRKTVNNEIFIKNYIKKRKNLIEQMNYLKYDKLFKNSIKSLKKLKEDNRIILVTRRYDKKNLFKQLKMLNLKNIFDKILVSGMKSKKELILGDQYFDKKNSIIIGDTEEDIQTGRSLGIKTIAVLSGIREKKYLKEYKPNLIIESLNNFVGKGVK